jgi:hypothetical protein
MTAIEEPRGLKKYLEEEKRAIAVSHRLHEPEFELFCELADLYERLGTLCRITTPEVARLASPTKLFQVVMSQMYGVGSQLLRRRILDADALSLRAIEATAIAYRLWKYPELCDIYENAYPNHEKEGHPKQWEPSYKYNEAFKLDQLFSEPEPAWVYFRSVHDAASAGSTHAAPLATAFHVQEDRAVLLQFIEPDNRIVRLTWNGMLNLYSEMLMLFLRILRGSAEPAAITAFEQDVRAWRVHAASIARQRDESPPSGLETGR